MRGPFVQSSLLPGHLAPRKWASIDTKPAALDLNEGSSLFLTVNPWETLAQPRPLFRSVRAHTGSQSGASVAACVRDYLCVWSVCVSGCIRSMESHPRSDLHSARFMLDPSTHFWTHSGFVWSLLGYDTLPPLNLRKRPLATALPRGSDVGAVLPPLLNGS